MSEITTIQIRKETKQKLNLMKAENRESYDRLIQNLLSQTDGVFVEDVITVNRDTVAMSLKYWEIESSKTSDERKTGKNFKSYDITFQELKIEPVGTTFAANPRPTDDNFINSVARIVAKEGDDVILLCRELSYIDGKWDSVSSVVHINLF